MCTVTKLKLKQWLEMQYTKSSNNSFIERFFLFSNVQVSAREKKNNSTKSSILNFDMCTLHTEWTRMQWGKCRLMRHRKVSAVTSKPYFILMSYCNILIKSTLTCHVRVTFYNSCFFILSSFVLVDSKIDFQLHSKMMTPKKKTKIHSRLGIS